MSDCFACHVDCSLVKAKDGKPLSGHSPQDIKISLLDHRLSNGDHLTMYSQVTLSTKHKLIYLTNKKLSKLLSALPNIDHTADFLDSKHTSPLIYTILPLHIRSPLTPRPISLKSIQTKKTTFTCKNTKWILHCSQPPSQSLSSTSQKYLHPDSPPLPHLFPISSAPPWWLLPLNQVWKELSSHYYYVP